MLAKKRIFVVIPAFCESRLIEKTIRSVPTMVERIVVVDDASTDDTAQKVEALSDPRVCLVRHSQNRGVGGAIYSGYAEALARGADVIVVMAGDNQMDGSDMAALVEPVVCREVSYVKGNRHVHPRAKDMPALRRWGSRFLAVMTSWAMGQRVGDSQCGYTAIGRTAALALDFASMWAGYGYPNDLLIALSKRRFSIAEVPVRPVYAEETSGLRPWHVLSILLVIARRWYKDRAVWSRAPNYSKTQLSG